MQEIEGRAFIFSYGELVQLAVDKIVEGSVYNGVIMFTDEYGRNRCGNIERLQDGGIIINIDSNKVHLIKDQE